MSITIIIIIVTCIISYPALSNRNMFGKLRHYPYQEARLKEYHRFLTSGFVHGSLAHLAINMYVLYVFGTYVEDYFLLTFGELNGRLLYLGLYLLTIIVADIPTYIKHKNNPQFSSVGASGAVSGILFIFILLKPWSILLLFFIIPAPAIILGIGYLIYSSWASRNSNDFIDHDAHFYGALFGILFAVVIQPSIFSSFLEKLINNFPL